MRTQASDFEMMPTKIILRGRKVVGGCAMGEAIVTQDTISGWGGINEKDGTVIERRHELLGRSFKDKVLVFPGAKGSSGWSAYFHMARLNGVAPRAMIFNKMTTKVALGAVVTRAVAMRRGQLVIAVRSPTTPNAGLIVPTPRSAPPGPSCGACSPGSPNHARTRLR